MLKQCQFNAKPKISRSFLQKKIANMLILYRGLLKISLRLSWTESHPCGICGKRAFLLRSTYDRKCFHNFSNVNTISQMFFFATFTPYAHGELVEFIKSYFTNTFGFSRTGLWLMMHHAISLGLCPFLELDFVLDEK